jgi:hypothetical protein
VFAAQHARVLGQRRDDMFHELVVVGDAGSSYVMSMWSPPMSLTRRGRRVPLILRYSAGAAYRRGRSPASR